MKQEIEGGTGLAPAFRSTWEVALEAVQIADEVGLDLTGILTSPLLRPPLPRPPAGNPDGSGRLPVGMDPSFLWHPTFWLPRGVRMRLPGEPDVVWHARLCLELTARQCLDPETFEFADPLNVFLGVNVTDSAGDRARVAAFARGAHDPELAEFNIPAGASGLLPTGWAAREAMSLVRDLAEAWDEMAENNRRIGEAELADRIARITRSVETDPAQWLAGIVEPGLDLDRAIVRIKAALDSLDFDTRCASFAWWDRVRPEEAGTPYDVEAGFREAQDERYRLIDAAHAAYIGQPTRDRLAGLMSTVHDLFVNLAKLGRRVASAEFPPSPPAALFTALYADDKGGPGEADAWRL